MLQVTNLVGFAAGGVGTVVNLTNSGDYQPTASSCGMRRTFAAPDTLNVWTFAAWIKLDTLGVQRSIWATGLDGNNESRIFFPTTNTWAMTDFRGGAADSRVSTAQTFATGIWYHLMVRYDTTQLTPSDRIRLYVDGVQTTTFEFSDYPAQNYTNGLINGQIEHYTGLARGIGADFPFDGKLADVHFVDGQSLGPERFISGQGTGNTKPIRYTGPYGTNGTRLRYENAGDQGEDSSGNGNNWDNGFSGTINQVVQSTDAPP